MFLKVLQYRERKRSQRGWVMFAIWALGFVGVLALFNGLGPLDRLLADSAAHFDGRKPSSDIVIVAIDDESLDKDALGYWPWPRSIHATLLDKLKAAGAKVIALDVIMTEPYKNAPEEDMVLAESIKRNAPVVLPIYTEIPLGADGWVEPKLPITELANSAASLAHINIELDVDGVARRMFLREGRDGPGGGIWYHMAAALWFEGTQEGSANEKHLKGGRVPDSVLQEMDALEEGRINNRANFSEWLRDYSILIPYAGGTGHFKRISYIDVMQDWFEPDDIRGKYVLVGATGAGMGDKFATPTIGDDARMPGVEIIANVLDGLVQNEYRYSSTRLQNFFFNIIIVAFIFPLLYLGRPKVVIWGVISLTVLSLLSMFLVRRYAGIQVAPVASLLTLALAYPFWSWRRLEQAMYQIRMEFSRMRRENGFFQAPKRMTGDRLERDLQAFESASWQLRELQQMVRQSMDALPHIMLLADERAQVILSNVQARQFFKVDPPLPTMAFEPAMGAGETETSELRTVKEHELPLLLKYRFMGSLLNQEHMSSYAREFLLYLKGEHKNLPIGAVEVVDAQKGDSYLLEVIPRVSTIEKSQGWIVTLINLGGAQHAEAQRNQVLRYLEDNVAKNLSGLQKSIEKLDAKATEVLPVIAPKLLGLNYQIKSFLNFQHAQTAIYFYKKLDLAEELTDVYNGVAQKHQFKEQAGVKLMADKGKRIIIQGDAQMLGLAMTTLLELLLKISGAEKMPQVRVAEQMPDEANPAIIHRAQVFLMTVIQDPLLAESKKDIFTQEIQHTAIPDEVDPDLLDWWMLKAIVSRHSGTIKMQQTAQSIGVMIEFIKQGV